MADDKWVFEVSVEGASQAEAQLRAIDQRLDDLSDSTDEAEQGFRGVEQSIRVSTEVSVTASDELRNFSNRWTELKSKIDLITGAFRVVTGAISSVVNVSLGLITSATSQQTAIEGLSRALELHHLDYAQLDEQVSAYNETQLELAGIADEDVRQALTAVAQATAGLNLSFEELTETTTLVQDVVAATGRSSDETARAIARVAAGQVEALRELVPGMSAQIDLLMDLEDASEAGAGGIELLTEAFGGASQAIDPLDLQMRQVTARWGDLWQEVGGTISRALVESGILERVEELLLTISDWIAENQDEIAEFFETFIFAIETAVNAIADLASGTIALGDAMTGGLISAGILNLERLRDLRIEVAEQLEDENLIPTAILSPEQIAANERQNRILAGELLPDVSDELEDEDEDEGATGAAAEARKSAELEFLQQKFNEEFELRAEAAELEIELAIATKERVTEIVREKAEERFELASAEIDAMIRVAAKESEIEARRAAQSAAIDAADIARLNMIASLTSQTANAVVRQLEAEGLSHGKLAVIRGFIEAAESVASFAVLDIRGGIAHAAASTAFFLAADEAGAGGGDDSAASTGGGGGDGPQVPVRQALRSQEAADERQGVSGAIFNITVSAAVADADSGRRVAEALNSFGGLNEGTRLRPGLVGEAAFRG